MKRPDHKVLAAGIMTGGIGLTSVQDGYIKYLSGKYPFHEMQTIRCGLALLMILLVLALRGELATLRPARPGLVALRSLVLGVASALFYIGLAAIPMADASAIYFAMPLLIAALSGVVIGEPVGLWRWIAAAAGFAGVVLTINPGSAVFEPASLATLIATFLYAVGHMLARPLGDSMPLGAMAFYQCAAFTLVALAMVAVFGSGIFASGTHVSLIYLTKAWSVPGFGDLFIFGGCAVAAAFGMYVYSASYRLASPSFVAPFEYTSMIWFATLGYVMFGDVPKASTAYGAAIIVAAGLFLIWAERPSKAVVTPQSIHE